MWICHKSTSHSGLRGTVEEERQIGRGTDRKQIVDADGFKLVRGKEKRNKSHVDGYVAGTEDSEEQNKRKIVSWSLP